MSRYSFPLLGYRKFITCDTVCGIDADKISKEIFPNS